jgi:hypothetical protein
MTLLSQRRGFQMLLYYKELSETAVEHSCWTGHAV